MDGQKQVVDRYLHSLLRHHPYPAEILIRRPRISKPKYTPKKKKKREGERDCLESKY